MTINKELIRELYNKSVIVCVENAKDNEHNVAWAWEEAFAEAIIRECVSVMSATAQDARQKFTYMGNDVPTCAHQSAVLKHFGLGYK
jgi:hypothetical protein